MENGVVSAANENLVFIILMTLKLSVISVFSKGSGDMK